MVSARTPGLAHIPGLAPRLAPRPAPIPGPARIPSLAHIPGPAPRLAPRPAPIPGPARIVSSGPGRIHGLILARARSRSLVRGSRRIRGRRARSLASGRISDPVGGAARASIGALAHVRGLGSFQHMIHACHHPVVARAVYPREVIRGALPGMRAGGRFRAGATRVPPGRPPVPAWGWTTASTGRAGWVPAR